jgi:hypothetical protein
MQNPWDGVLRNFSTRWRNLVDWYHFLAPARMSLVAVILMVVLFWRVPQGQDILVGLASYPNANTTRHPLLDFTLRIASMLVALYLAGLSIWGWARLLLGCDFGGVPAQFRARAEEVSQFVRRSMGYAPSFCMAAAFVRISILCRDEWYLFLGAAILCLLVAVILHFHFDTWSRRETRLKGGQVTRYHNVRQIVADPSAYWAVIVSYAGTILAFVSLTLWPVRVGEALGSSAVVLLAIAAWTAAGSTLVYFGSRYRIPTLMFAFLLALACSFINDNHAIRTLNETLSDQDKVSLDAALDKWLARVSQNYPLPDKAAFRPLYLVSASGGGIRAAYWPAIILGHIEDRAGDPQNNKASFAAHVFAMSGVSGGALGEITFTALIATGPTSATYESRAQWLLDRDFLAADVGKMFFADLFQRFFPIPIPLFDRARSLEDAWADAWDQSEQPVNGNPMNRGVADLYRRADSNNLSLPSLFLNGTSAETGKRIITSNLQVEPILLDHAQLIDGDHGVFTDAVSGCEKLQGREIRLSTAAHQSARFTYFSPAGRFPDGTRIVDGGYFENSGATTLLDLMDAIRRHIDANKAGNPAWNQVRIHLVLIDNNPLPPPPAPPEPGHTPAPDPAPRRFAAELMSPLDALMATRDARGSYAQCEAVVLTGSGDNPNPVSPVGQTFQFNLAQRDITLPLGWSLSGQAVTEMNAQLATTGSATCEQIVSELPPAPRTK